MINYNSEEHEMRLTTAHGVLVVTAIDDPDYPGVSIAFQVEGHENDYATPIALIEDCDESVSSSETRGDAVVVRIYSDCELEGYTDRVDIPLKTLNKCTIKRG